MESIRLHLAQLLERSPVEIDADTDFDDWIRQIETKLTIYEINTILALENFDKIEGNLGKFLAKRWQRIQNTNLSYPQDTDHIANGLCLTLAECFYEELNISKFMLLMPTLSVEINEVTKTSIWDETLLLKDFVLSDDNQRFIEVGPCLEYIKVSGEHNHTSLYNGKVKKLSKAEIERVTNRTPDTRIYYDALMLSYKIKHEGASVGAYIRRLINGLRKGDMLRRGDEENAGNDAYFAMHEFNTFLNKLDEEQKLTLFKTGHNFGNKHYNIGDTWESLVRESKLDDEECVFITANTFEHIMDANPQLNTIFIDGHDEQERFARGVEENLNQAEQSYFKSDTENTQISHPCYGEIGDKILCAYLLIDENILNVLNDRMLMMILSLSLAENIYDTYILERFNFEQRNRLLSVVGEYHEKFLLKDLMENGIDTGDIIKFQSRIQIIPLDKRYNVLRHIRSKSYLKVLYSGYELKLILGMLPKNVQYKFLMWLGQSINTQIIKGGNDFCIVTSMLTENECEKYINNVIGRDHLMAIIKSSNEYYRVLSLLPRDVSVNLYQIRTKFLNARIINASSLAYAVKIVMNHIYSNSVTFIFDAEWIKLFKSILKTTDDVAIFIDRIPNDVLHYILNSYRNDIKDILFENIDRIIKVATAFPDVDPINIITDLIGIARIKKVARRTDEIIHLLELLPDSMKEKILYGDEKIDREVIIKDGNEFELVARQWPDKNKKFFIETFKFDYLREIIKDVDQLCNILLMLGKTHRLKFIKNLKCDYKKIIQSFDDLCTIMELLPKTKRIIFLQLIDTNHLPKLINNNKKLRKLLLMLNTSDWQVLDKLFGDVYRDILSSNEIQSCTYINFHATKFIMFKTYIYSRE